MTVEKSQLDIPGAEVESKILEDQKHYAQFHRV